MGRVCAFARLGRAGTGLAASLLVLLAWAGAARAFSGTARYDGDLGPVNAQTPLCICLFTDGQLTNGLGCLIFRRNNAGYQIRIDRDVYAIAFLDLHINERLDADEPFEIFPDRGAPPGELLEAGSTRADVDFIFGDENLPAAAVAGDCDGDGSVSIGELVRAVGVALESLPLSACPAADGDGDGLVRIEELISALNAALDG